MYSLTQRRENDMKTMTERIHWINEVAQNELERAYGMLDMFNDMYGTDLKFLNRRVVYSKESGSNVAAFYADCHDFESMLKYGLR